MPSPRSLAALLARVLLGLIFLHAGAWKVFDLGAVSHARNLFVVPYSESFLPSWSLWTAGITVPFLELMCGGLLLVGWRRMEAAMGLALVLVLVTFGHLLADPLHAFNTHVLPRTLLLVVLLVLWQDDSISIDGRLSKRAGPPTSDLAP